MTRVVLYTYNIDEERFSQTSHVMLEREIKDIESVNEHELVFVVGTLPNAHMRISVAPKPGKVYYDRNSASYRVWFYSQDRDKAIEAIGNYILDRVAPEIRTHQSFIERLQNERASAMKLLDKLPSD